MGAVSFTISDRIAAVYARSMSLLQALLKKHSRVKMGKRGDFTEYSDNVIQVMRIILIFNRESWRSWEILMPEQKSRQRMLW